MHNTWLTAAHSHVMGLQVGRLARKELRAEELAQVLMSSAERNERERVASQREGALWDAIDVIADLMRRHNVRVPCMLLMALCYCTAVAPVDVKGPGPRLHTLFFRHPGSRPQLVQVTIPRQGSGCFNDAGTALRDKTGCSCLLLHDLIDAWNDEGPLLGSKKVPEGDVYFPVAMYVHNRPQYFERALKNLEKASGVERVPLLIVSMDSLDSGGLPDPRSSP